jgi:hypothetical protein
MAAEMTQTMDARSIPAGGIADFVMSDSDMAALEQEQAQKEFGGNGIAQFKEAATRMAGYGRFGDDSVAHVQTGEIIVPLALIKNNPALREQIFQNLRDNGIEDPERYVVGSQSNSLNPETGMMEFGWLKDIWKGVKNVVKSVVNVIKKIAPVVLPIVASTIFGPLWGAALGSGIATLINGGSIKEAFVSGLKGAALGGIGAFAGGALSGGFSGGMNALKGAASFSNLSAGFQNIGNALPKALGGSSDYSGISYKNMAQGPTGAGGTNYVAPEALTNPNLITVSSKTPTVGKDLVAQQAAADTGLRTDKNAWDYVFRGGKTPADIAAAQNTAQITATQNALNTSVSSGLSASDPNVVKAALEAGAKAASSAGPGMLARFGPSALAATGVAAGLGAFKVPEQDPAGVLERDGDGNVITGEDLIRQDPSKYLVADLGATYLDPNTGKYVQRSNYNPMENSQYGIQPYQFAPYSVPTNYGLSQNILQGSTPGGPFARPQQYAAQGGEIFPRRTGGVMPNEGIPNQDSVRAMLMPGEFVMTTDAVKGMGNGNANQGIQNMYSVMRDLEYRGRRG